MVKVGTCGFPVAMKKLFLSMDAVETQKTFYTPVDEETVRRWRSLAPDTLEFTVKALQVITHPATSPTYRRFKGEIGNRENYGFFKGTDEVKRAMELTLERAKILKARVIVFQTPASFKPVPENLENAIRFFREWKGDFDFVLEVRGEWKENQVRELIQKAEISHAVDPFKFPYVGGKIAYFRLHGRGKGYRYEYTEKDLGELLDMIPQDRSVYVMFNNTNMYRDALKFRELLKKIAS